MDHDLISRRLFLAASVNTVLITPFAPASAQAKSEGRKIQSVRGPIEASDFGIALPHEHVICDFIGADATGRHRWDSDDVFRRMLPYLTALKQSGVSTFFDCTPAFIGRDPLVLRRLSRATGLNIVTNTGLYGGAKDKYIPAHAYQMRAEDMAEAWIEEYETGIDSNGIRPGFIKIGVDSIETETAPLSKIDGTLVRAAAIVSRETGLSVTCHTGGGNAGVAALRRFIDQGAAAASFIVAHADNHGLPLNRKVADLGGWVSFDAIGRRPLKQHLEIVPAMLSHRADRLLISQDKGWYSVGEPNGGEVQGYTDLTGTFLPALRQAGVSQEQIDQLVKENPWNAFAN